MMRAALIVLALFLAGCAGGPQHADDAPGVVTDPRDLSYLDRAAPGTHVHDYWQGRDQVTVIDGQASGSSNCAYYNTQEIPWTRFRPADGVIVPQGTGELEVVLAWQDGNLEPDPASLHSSDYTHVEFLVKTAIDAAPRHLDPVRRVDNGVAFRFASTNDWDDLPHYVLSLWEFQPLVVNEAGDSTTFCGSFTLTVTAFRTLPLKEYGEHPDQWLGSDRIGLVDAGGATFISIGPTSNSTTVGSYSNYVMRPTAGAVVPGDARAVEVVIEVGAGSGPARMLLGLHGADTRDFTDVEAAETTADRQVFHVEVTGRGDSPYATQSLWEFWIRPDMPADAGPWQGEWSLTARALR